MAAETEESKVTTDKIKNPGRQEWGRKLGKMSKELKLKKQLQENTNIEQPPSKHGYSIRIEYCLALATLLIGLGALYYQKKSFEKQQTEIKQPEVKKPQFPRL